jgi:FkbM family methyltransferase
MNNYFEESRKKYEITLNKTDYMKNIHNKIMDYKQLSNFIENSMIDKVVIDRTGIYIILNEEYYNIKLYINDNDFEEVPISILSFDRYEQKELKMVNKILDIYEKKDITVFDIGSNIGWYSLNLLKKYKNINIFSFEPSPVTFKRIKRNFELNEFNTDKIFNIGFFNENSKLDFYYDKEGSGASSLVNLRERESVKKISVEMAKIDDFVEMNNISNIDFIKCDVEGAELFVYQGGKKVIEESKPIIFSEMLRKWSAKFGYHPNDIINFMKEIGYQCYTITDNYKLRKIEEVTEKTVETNYFFLHKEKHTEIIEQLV